MLTWVTLGLAMSGTSIVLAWKRLQISFRAKKKARQSVQAPVRQPTTTQPQAETALAG
jgi:hypothetical protein